MKLIVILYPSIMPVHVMPYRDMLCLLREVALIKVVA